MWDKCPNCKYSFTAHTDITNEIAKPTEGDYTICINCGSVLLYQKDTLKLMTEEEIDNLPWGIKDSIGILKVAWREVTRGKRG
jgi:hypothetical protein